MNPLARSVYFSKSMIAPYRNGAEGPSWRQPLLVFQKDMGARDPLEKGRPWPGTAPKRRDRRLRRSAALRNRGLGRLRSLRLRLGRMRLLRVRLRRLTRLGELAVALHAVHLGIGGRHRPRRTHRAGFAIRLHDAEIVLRMLIEVFRRDSVARGRGFAGKRDIALEHLIGVAANFDARPVAVEGLRAIRWARSPVVVGVTAHIIGIMIAAPGPLVLSWSHDTF